MHRYVNETVHGVTITALVVAGGRSRRMGRDKATLVFEGEPLWSRQFRILHEIKPQALWLSAQTRPDWSPAGVEVITDKAPSRGPLSGLGAALDRLLTTHLLVLAVDLPRMTAEHLRKLCALARPGCGVVPRNGDYFEPLCAVYPVEARGDARLALAGKDVSMQAFVRNLLGQSRMKLYPVPANESSLYCNVNTPEDLAAAGI
jgi:molybdenum cofactor guanylyltransferase